MRSPLNLISFNFLITLKKLKKQNMKRVALMARKFGVDSKVVSAMFIGYFVLLIACGITIFNMNTHQDQDSSSVTATHQQSSIEGTQMKN